MAKDKNIITKETKEGKGIYIMEIDKSQASKVTGNTHTERVTNAINDFLKGVQGHQKFSAQPAKK